MPLSLPGMGRTLPSPALKLASSCRTGSIPASGHKTGVETGAARFGSGFRNTNVVYNPAAAFATGYYQSRRKITPPSASIIDSIHLRCQMLAASTSREDPRNSRRSCRAYSQAVLFRARTHTRTIRSLISSREGRRRHICHKASEDLDPYLLSS